MTNPNQQQELSIEEMQILAKRITLWTLTDKVNAETEREEYTGCHRGLHIKVDSLIDRRKYKGYERFIRVVTQFEGETIIGNVVYHKISDPKEGYEEGSHLILEVFNLAKHSKRQRPSLFTKDAVEYARGLLKV